MYDIDKILKKYTADYAKENTAFSAAKYSVESGGKRLRPNFVMYTANMLHRIDEKIERMAVAIEMIHTYSLIHDDLPSMDNDDMRRGKPSCHKAFGEGMAVLAGDALLSKAFEILTDVKSCDVNYVHAINVIAKYAGADGMVFGQSLDIEGKNASEKQYMTMIKHKTADMFMASMLAPAVYFGVTKKDITLITEFSENFGILFQIADDISDNDGWAASNRERALEIGITAFETARRAISEMDYEVKFFSDILNKTRAQLI